MIDYQDFIYTYSTVSVQMLIVFYFFTKFLKKKIGTLYYLLFTLFGTMIIMGIQAGNIVCFLVCVLLLIIGGVFVCKVDGISAVLYAIITVEIMQFCYGIFDSVFCILYPFLFSFYQKIGILWMSLRGMALLVVIFCYMIIYQYFLYYKIEKKQYILILLAPTVMIVFMGEYIRTVFLGNTIITDKNGTILNLVNKNYYLIFAIQFIGLISLFCMMFAYKKLVENFCLSTEVSLLEQAEHSLNQYIEEAKTRYEKTRSFRHDIKNHITVIKELLQNENAEQAFHYIKDMEGMAEELSFPCNTNHPVVDILIGNKLGIARSMGIDTSCSFVLPYPCLIRDIDFCIILSNALDNAIHACQDMGYKTKRYIDITGHIQGDFILLNIENSVQGKQFFQEGTGLSNIRAVAEKYCGTICIKTQDTRFILSVLLIIPQHTESISQQIY